MVTQRHNRDHEVDVQQFIENVYKPPDPRNHEKSTGYALASAKFDACPVYRLFLVLFQFGDPYQTSLNSLIPPIRVQYLLRKVFGRGQESCLYEPAQSLLDRMRRRSSTT